MPYSSVNAPGGNLIGNALTMNAYSANMEIQNANYYHIQNEMLQKFKGMQSVNSSKVNNLKVETYNLNWYNVITAYIYIGFALIFIIFCFVGKKMANWSVFSKIMISVIIILFPFVITSLEQILMKMFSYIMNFTNGSPYVSPSY